MIGSDIGLSPGLRQAISWANAEILLIEPLGTKLSEILIELHTFSFKTMHLKMSSGKWRPFCLGPNVLTKHESVSFQNSSLWIEKLYQKWKKKWKLCFGLLLRHVWLNCVEDYEWGAIARPDSRQSNASPLDKHLWKHSCDCSIMEL